VHIKRALVAPCGTTADQDILHGIAREFHGIDISPVALRECNEKQPQILTKEGDILRNGYEERSFDLVASFLFLHHIHKVGFDKFLQEFHRILSDNGLLVILEPSALSPFSAITRLVRKVVGNISGLVPDESPIVPSRLNDAIDKAGFRIVRFEGVSFSHNRIPVPLQYLIEAVSALASKSPLLSQAAWMCVWICRKA
jgi:SAM-dependent methyltransferase